MDYKYFLAVVETGSLASAGERLHIAPSAISRQIALLEESIGLPLFERRPKGMTLTAAGDSLAAHAQRARLEEENLLTALRNGDYENAHTVRLTSTEGLSRYFIPEIIAEYTVCNPTARFILNTKPPADCVQMVRNGDADIGLIFNAVMEQDLQVNHSYRTKICAIMAPGHPLANKSQLTLSELLPFPMALTLPGTTQRRLFDHVCQNEQFSFSELFVCNYSGALHELVRRTHAIALGSLISHRHAPPQ